MLVALVTLPPGGGCSSCHDIGCVDRVVSIEAGQLPTALLPFNITGCVDGTCHEIAFNVTEQGTPNVPVSFDIPLDDVEVDQQLAVTISIASSSSGTVLLTSEGTARTVRYRAAGDCGPTCTNASLTLDKASGLLESR